MEIPEHLHELVNRLGEALVQALVNDEQCRGLAQAIQGEGFDLAVMLEATLALRRREAETDTDESLPFSRLTPLSGQLQDGEGSEIPRPRPPVPEWSEEDRAFLQTFRISLD